MKTVLITGIGGDIAQAVARIIREQRPDIRLVGVDIHRQHGGMGFVDEFIEVPRADAPGYLAAIRALLVSESIDVLIPMTEPELGAIGPLMRELGENKCLTAGESVVRTGLDKLTTISKLKELGLPVPWTFAAADGLPAEYPCILKSRFGSGSRTTLIVKDAAEAAYLAGKHADAIFQQLLEPADREVTCAVYRRRNGDVASLLMLRRLTGGFTSWAKVIRDEPTMRLCQQIAVGLDLRGSMNVQLRITNQGPRVFEINPRFSSTVLMRHLAGFSDVIWSLDEAAGKPVVFPTIPENLVMVRIQSALVVK